MTAFLSASCSPVRPEIIAIRLYDVGYEIDLARAEALWRQRDGGRYTTWLRPLGQEAAALVMPHPPLRLHVGVVSLPTRPAAPERVTVRAEVSLYDFGVLAVRLRAAAPVVPEGEGAGGAALWNTLANEIRTEWADRVRDEVVAILRESIERPDVSAVFEDYTIFRVEGFVDASGREAPYDRVPPHEPLPVPLSVIGAHDVAPLLLGERRVVMPETVADMLPYRFGYYTDDLVIPSWEAALVVDASGAESDVELLIEIANAQLLELRYYDDLLTRELMRLNDEVATVRQGWRRFLPRRFSRVLLSMQVLVADSTELVERVNNALRITDDVYGARLYGAMLELFRGQKWRQSIAHKLDVLRQTYGMLNSEAQAMRSEMLEVSIVVLILVEIVLSLWRH